MNQVDLKKLARKALLMLGVASMFIGPACGGSGSNESRSVDFDAATALQLDEAITSAMHEAAIPGVIVGLWMRSRGAYVRAFGVADQSTGAPMTSDPYMRIGSETKTFTVTAMLQLVDQGKIGLDDVISNYVAGVPEGERITLRELAGMQSGIYDFTDDADFLAALSSHPDRTFSSSELLGYAFKHPLKFEPGTRFQYSNTNAVLLGLVIEKVSGQSVDDYLQQHVFAPLHLGNTSYPTTASFPSPHPRGYTEVVPDGAILDTTDWNLGWAGPAGAMISNLDDLHIWAPALATGALLSPATQSQRMQSVVVPGTSDVHYGLGLFDTSGWVGHNGSIPGYQSFVFYLAPEDATLVILVNTDIPYQQTSPTSRLGSAITRIVTPQNVVSL